MTSEPAASITDVPPPAPPVPPPPPAPPGPFADYPVRFSVDYPEGPRNRLTVFFRWILAIPITLLVAMLGGSCGPTFNYTQGFGGGATPAGGTRTPPDFTRQLASPDVLAWVDWFFEPEVLLLVALIALALFTLAVGWATSLGPAVFLIAPVTAMLLLRGKYPLWWFEWNLQMSRFVSRVGAYTTLLRDEYPSTDEEQAVHLEIDPPVGASLSGLMPFVKWFLATPHYAVLGWLSWGQGVAHFIGWWAILITGRLPRSLFDFLVAVRAWQLRVSGYAFMLVTDRYPPFRLGSSSAVAAVLVAIGVCLAVVVVLLLVLLFSFVYHEFLRDSLLGPGRIPLPAPVPGGSPGRGIGF